jgi:hypothetical protein
MRYVLLLAFGGVLFVVANVLSASTNEDPNQKIKHACETVYGQTEGLMQCELRESYRYLERQQQAKEAQAAELAR